MEGLRPGSAWFLGEAIVDTWNNLDDKWFCDESVPELFTQRRTEIIGDIREEWLQHNRQYELKSQRGQSDWNYCLVEVQGLLENLHKIRLDLILQERTSLLSEFRLSQTRWYRCTEMLELCQRLRKLRRMENSERLDMERLRTMLPLITSRNNIFTARVSAEEGIYMKMIVNPVIHYLAIYLRSLGSCGLATSYTSYLQHAYENAISLRVKFLASTSSKGGIGKRIGGHTINAPKYLSVRHPIIQMVLFDKRSIFSRTKSKAPRSIFNTTKTLNSFVSPNVCGADWISAKPNLESIKAGTWFELNVRESFGKSNKPNDDEPQNRLDILETKDITEHIQVDQCSYNTRRCGIEKAFISVLPVSGRGGLGKTTLSQLLTGFRHPLIQMALFGRKKFEDMSSCINFVGPKSMFTMTRRLCSFALGNGCGAEWAYAKLKSESLCAGMSSEQVLRENIGRSNNLTENEAQRKSVPDSCGAKHGTKAVTTKITSASWVVATAAPHHATGNRDLLHGFVTEHDDQFVHAVDGVPMPVKARGAVVTDTTVLPDVWFVPGLKSNMVSVSQLAEQGYCVGFGSDECCIRSAGGGKIVGKARPGKDELYKLDFLKVSLAM